MCGTGLVAFPVRAAGSGAGEGDVIVACSYEELAALRAGAESMLDAAPDTRAPGAPGPTRTDLELLLDRLSGDLSLSTLADQMAVEHAVRAVVGHLRSEMEVCVVSGHPADEASVAAYFDFAHGLSVLARVRMVGRQMRQMAEVMTGTPVDGGTIRTFVFPD